MIDETPELSDDENFMSQKVARHLMNAGYSNVDGLIEGADGVWHAKATKNGRLGPVLVDPNGTIAIGGCADRHCLAAVKF